MSATVKPGYKQTEVGVIPECGLMYQSGRWVRLTKGKAFGKMKQQAAIFLAFVMASYKRTITI